MDTRSSFELNGVMNKNHIVENEYGEAEKTTTINDIIRSIGNESSFYNEHRLEADCGPSSSNAPILSKKIAVATAALYHPGVIRKDGLSYEVHHLSSSLGWHEFPFRTLFSKKSPTEGILLKYGIAIDLWFKLLVGRRRTN